MTAPPRAPETVRADVVVVGAGTAGTQAALQLARTGRSVVLVDRRPAGQGGARWCNGVVAWQFARAGLAPPQRPELRADGGPVHLLSPSRAHRVRIDDSPIAEADMRLLGQRLWSDAEAAGVDLRWGVRGIRVHVEWGRPRAITGSVDGEEVRFEAALFVDASGRTGVLRDAVPALAAWCPPAQPADLCSAQHLILEVDDADGARRFLKEVEAEPGEAVDHLGLAGGYSVAVIRVEESLEEVSVLVGTLAEGGHGSGPDLMRRIRHEHPWMGRSVFGGGALIPLRRTYDRLAVPGLALVGDAGAQVMAVHGSGIGFGLIAGKVLAEATAGHVDPGSPEAMWAYQARYLREFGPILGAYDAFRRMSVALGSDGVERLFASGVFGPSLIEPGLHQRLGSPPAHELAGHARALLADRALAAVVVPALVRAGASQLLYRAYPTRPSERALRTWSRLAGVVLGA
ncbi:MAG: NAD(P)/FAD-dependent oxidoreductase [Actinobacteria bacterium]|nr:NAD(P)/FAD-dependent oxidoreductase [Actinomycetota bacterium]